MSHYTVLVITEDGDYEKALEPFDENIQVEPYINKTRAQIIEEYHKDSERYRGTEDEGYFLKKWKSFDLTEDDIIVKRYREYWEDDNIKFDNEGNELTTYNPNSKWDWYSLGGRWNGTFALKEGAKVIKESELPMWDALHGAELESGRADFAQFKDIDFSTPVEEASRAARFWEITVEGSPKTDEEKEDDFFESFYKPSYYIEKYQDKETFIEETTSFRTYAILYKGEWLEPGPMGWFGVSLADSDGCSSYREVFKKIMSELKPTDYLAVVDCHI